MCTLQEEKLSRPSKKNVICECDIFTNIMLNCPRHSSFLNSQLVFREAVFGNFHGKQCQSLRY